MTPSLINPATTIFFIVMFIILLFILASMVTEIGKRNIANEKEYEAYYRAIKHNLDEWEHTKENYDKLKLRLDNLGMLRWKNDEKTRVLTEEFYKRYSKFWCEKHLERGT